MRKRDDLLARSRYKKRRKANIMLERKSCRKNRTFEKGYNLTSTKEEYYNIEGEIKCYQ